MTRRGLSLFEVLVALGVIAALAVALGNFVGDLDRSRERIGAATRRQRAADAMFAAIERSLATTVVEDARLGPGVRGTAERLEIVARDVPAWRLGTAASRAMALDDRQRIVVLGGFGGGDAAGRLRRTGPDGDRDTMLEAVLRFRYHDGIAWQGAFDSASAGAMPRLVEVNLWWPRPGDFEERDPLDAELAAFDDREEADAPGAFGPGDPLGFDEEDLGFEDDAQGAAGVAREDLGGPVRPPDRVRLIAIPDAGPMPEAIEASEVSEAIRAGDPMAPPPGGFESEARP